MDTQHVAVHQLEHTATWLLGQIAGDGNPPTQPHEHDRIAELAARLVPVLDALSYLDSGDHDHEH